MTKNARRLARSPMFHDFIEKNIPPDTICRGQSATRIRSRQVSGVRSSI